MSAQPVPPADIRAAVANPALRDEQSIMVNVGELRRLVRKDRAMTGVTPGQARQLALLTSAWQTPPVGTTYSVLSALAGKGLAERRYPYTARGRVEWRLTVEGERRLKAERAEQ